MNVHLDLSGEGSSNRNASRDESSETRDESVDTRNESIEDGENPNNHAIMSNRIPLFDVDVITHPGWYCKSLFYKSQSTSLLLAD